MLRILSLEKKAGKEKSFFANAKKQEQNYSMMHFMVIRLFSFFELGFGGV